MTSQDTSAAVNVPAEPGTGTSTIEISEMEERVLAEVTGMLHEVIGEEYVLDMEITMDTSFNADLEMESIEFVTLAEAMRERYGDTVDFVGFLAEMDVDRVINMAVGEVVEFIARCLAGGDPTGRLGTITSLAASGDGDGDGAAFGDDSDRAAFGDDSDRAAFGDGSDRVAYGPGN